MKKSRHRRVGTVHFFERLGRVDLTSVLVARIQSEITGNAHVRSHDD